MPPGFSASAFMRVVFAPAPPPGVAAAAIAVEGLVALPAEARRQHVHFTHVRTKHKKAVQPHQLTRRQFWKHLERCFAEAYPDASSSTGSILRFGVVVKEKHRDAPLAADRSEHHHAATFASAKYYWRRPANRLMQLFHAHAARSYTCQPAAGKQFPTRAKPHTHGTVDEQNLASLTALD